MRYRPRLQHHLLCRLPASASASASSTASPRRRLHCLNCLHHLRHLRHLVLRYHCDLKPENILLSSFSRCRVKLIDFGSSCFAGEPHSSYVQSRSYRAPEVISADLR